MASVESGKPEAEAEGEGAKKRGLLKKESAETDKPEKPKAASKGSDIKKADKPKKKRFQFLREVKGELKRVTWPSKKDVGQWTAVVVAALVFFGAYVAILDNLVITPSLIGVSSIEMPEEPKSDAESADAGEGDAALDATAGAEGAEAGSVEGEAQAAGDVAADAAQEGAEGEQAASEAPVEGEGSGSSQEG